MGFRKCLAMRILNTRPLFIYATDARGGLFERVNFEPFTLANGDRMETEFDEEGYTKRVFVVRENGSREEIKFTSQRSAL